MGSTGPVRRASGMVGNGLVAGTPAPELELRATRYVHNVRHDFMEGVRSGVNGTPTFFLDGERWNGPYTADSLRAGIEGHAAPDVEPMSGLPWEGGPIPHAGPFRRAPQLRRG